ncbi:tether containing ubx domain for glut4 [Anaeramoeba flamelloides]|uniref:Tether containing ubx domain for glut4 n=1 Tax=Anaeramoeba flamelloides TaxID=1746091 RepID=A0AAV7ZVB5_9EUKA|nr:tether containing ubx domain for glut4 [Anaeramoeba flamelloides]
MSIKVSVSVGSRKREEIIITPNTKLSEIVQEVCKRNKLKGNYLLKYKKKPLDSSLPFRLTGLPRGARFVLSSDKKRTAKVLIALDLENGERVTKEFLSNTTLWNIVRKFDQQLSPTFELAGLVRQSMTKKEKKQHVKKKLRGNKPSRLKAFKNKSKTDRSKVEIKKKIFGDFWMQPILVFTNEDFVGVEKLQKTTLQSMGITSGNARFRYSTLITEMSLGDAIEIYCLTKPYQEAQLKNKPNQTTTKKRKEKGKEKEKDKENKNQNKNKNQNINKNQNEKETQQEEKKKKKLEQRKKTEELLYKRRQKQKEEEEEKRKQKEVSRLQELEMLKKQGEEFRKKQEKKKQELLQKQAYSNNNNNNYQNQGGNFNLESGTTKILQSSTEHSTFISNQRKKIIERKKELERQKEEKEIKQLEKFQDKTFDQREIIVIGPPDTLEGIDDFILPDKYFKHTKQDIKYLAITNQQKIEEMSQFTTREQRENKKKNTKVYKKVLIKFMFPDRLSIQASFHPREKIQILYHFVRFILNQEYKQMNFELFTTPPKYILSQLEKTLRDENLIPRCMVYISFSNKSLNTSELIKRELITNIIDDIVARELQREDLLLEKERVEKKNVKINKKQQVLGSGKKSQKNKKNNDSKIKKLIRF